MKADWLNISYLGVHSKGLQFLVSRVSCYFSLLSFWCFVVFACSFQSATVGIKFDGVAGSYSVWCCQTSGSVCEKIWRGNGYLGTPQLAFWCQDVNLDQDFLTRKPQKQSARKNTREDSSIRSSTLLACNAWLVISLLFLALKWSPLIDWHLYWHAS